MEKQFSYQNLLDAGFTEAEAKKAFTDKLTAAGFAKSEINSYLQNVSGVRPTSLAGDEQNTGITKFAQTIDQVTQEARKEGVNLGFKDAIQRGWRQSVMGMIKNKQMPRELTPEEEASLNFFERLAMGVSEVISDTPVYLVGAKIGGAAMGAAGAAIGTVAPGPGNVIGGAGGVAIGGSAGAFGFHRAARAVLIDMYQRGEIADFDELIYRVKNTSKEFGKGAIVGGFTGGAGKVAGIGSKALMGAAASRTGAAALALKAGAKAAPTGSEILGLTVAGSAVEGQVPTAQDFLDSATLILTLKGAHKVTDVGANKIKNTVVDNLYKRFVENGENPKEVVEKAAHDPLELQKILTEKQEIKKGYNEVKENPELGTREGKDDILATMKPEDLGQYIIKRGAAIVDKKGNVVVRGRELNRQTGTQRNFGFSKMVFSKGLSVEQMQQLPEFLRQYKPVEETETQLVYRIPSGEESPFKIVFTKSADGNNLVHMSLDEASRGKTLSAKKAGLESQSPAVIQGKGYTDASPIETSGQGPTNSIAEKVAEVKAQIINPTKEEIKQPLPKIDISEESTPEGLKKISDLKEKFNEEHPTKDRQDLMWFLVKEITPDALAVPKSGEVKTGDKVLVKNGKKIVLKRVENVQGDIFKLEGSKRTFFLKDILIPSAEFKGDSSQLGNFNWGKIRSSMEKRLGVNEKDFNQIRSWLTEEQPAPVAENTAETKEGPKYDYKVSKGEKFGFNQDQREHIANEIINNTEGSLFSRFKVKSRVYSDYYKGPVKKYWWVDKEGKTTEAPKTAGEKYQSNENEIITINIPNTKAVLRVNKDPLAIRSLLKDLGVSIKPKPEYAGDKMYSKGAGDYAGEENPIFAYQRPDYQYRVKIPFENKETLPQGEVNAKDAIKKRTIIDKLKKVFDVPVRGWKIPRQGRGALGVFFSKAEMVRVKFANDLTTTAHELGHYLEKKMYGRVASPEITAHYDELSKFASKPKGAATKGKIAAEGFAQFLSTYVVDAKKAKEMAPKFYEKFESELKAKEPEVYNALQEARAEVEKYVKQPAAMEVLSNISIREDGKPAMTTREKWQAVKNKIKVKWLDDKAPLLRIVEQLEKKTGKKIDFAKNPYYLARLFPGWVGRAEAFIEDGAFNFHTLEKTGKSFKDIIEKAENLDELRAYLVAKRAIELQERPIKAAQETYEAAIKAGKSEADAREMAKQVAKKEKIETGIRPEAAKQTVKELEGKYKEIAQELYEYQNALLKYQLDSGLISAETYAKIKAKNKYRVPFYRVMEGGKDYAIGSRTMASKQVVKRLKGSTRTIIDPLEGIIKDTYETINAVERNRVGQALADLSEIEGAGEFVFKVDTPVKGVKAFGESKEQFVPSQTIEKDNQIKVFRNGKAEVYEVDKDVATLINGLNPSEANAFIRAARFFTNSLRAGATIYNFAFTVKNFLRDSVFAFLLTNSKYNPVKHALGGAKAVITKDETYWQFKKAGGDQSSFFSVDRNSLQKEILTLEKTGYAKSVWNLIKAKEFAAAWEAGVLEPMRYPGEISELTTRLGEFKSSVKKYGKSKEGLEKSGYAAREITIDFAKAGINARAINMVAAFFNANLQGIVKTGEVLGKHTLKATTFLGTLGILEAIINYDWNKGKEDEDIAELPRAQRNINYVFKVGDTIYRIPKPQQIGFVSTMFSQITTAALDRMNKNDRDDLLRNTAQAFVNEFDMNPMPNAFGVPIEIWANKSFFFDRPIVPASAENLLPEYQYTQNTTELTKFISSKLGGWIGKENTFSPAKAEHIVRGWTGGAGTTILKATDLALRKAGIVPDPVKPAPTLSDIPFVKGFVMRHPSSSAESIQRFYDEYQSRMKKYNSFKAMSKQMNVGEINELAPYAAYGGLNAMYRGMSENGAAIRNIYNNPEMSADEKRQVIDQLYLIQIQLAKTGLKTIKEIDKQVEDTKKAAKKK